MSTTKVRRVRPDEELARAYLLNRVNRRFKSVEPHPVRRTSATRPYCGWQGCRGGYARGSAFADGSENQAGEISRRDAYPTSGQPQEPPEAARSACVRGLEHHSHISSTAPEGGNPEGHHEGQARGLSTIARRKERSYLAEPNAGSFLERP